MWGALIYTLILSIRANAILRVGCIHANFENPKFRINKENKVVEVGAAMKNGNVLKRLVANYLKHCKVFVIKGIFTQ